MTFPNNFSSTTLPSLTLSASASQHARNSVVERAGSQSHISHKMGCSDGHICLFCPKGLFSWGSEKDVFCQKTHFFLLVYFNELLQLIWIWLYIFDNAYVFVFHEFLDDYGVLPHKSIVKINFHGLMRIIGEVDVDSLLLILST